MPFAKTYNARLFSRGTLRSSYHLNRYHWLAKQIKCLPYQPRRVIELGCFDSKSLDFVGVPSYYLGLDANWEGGLDIGKQRWSQFANVELLECRHPDQIPDRGIFDIGVCLETFEHMAYDLIDAYLAKLASVIRGRMFITVPREHGPAFLAKRFLKTICGYDGLEHYTWKEVALLGLGRTGSVERCEHKGFDERRLTTIVGRHFRVDSVTGLFPPRFPQFLSFAVGIVATSE